MAERTGFFRRGVNFQEVRRFQTLGEYQLWWETQQHDWRRYNRGRNDDRHYYLCKHHGPNGPCPARMRVVSDADGQRHVVSVPADPDIPHQHTNPQNVGRIDTLRIPHVEYVEFARFETEDEFYFGWWVPRAVLWRFGSMVSLDDGEMRWFYGCAHRNRRGRRGRFDCPARMCYIFASPPSELIIVKMSSVPHNH